MNTPTPDEVRARSELLTVRFPAPVVPDPPPPEPAPDPLAPYIAEATALVMALTGRSFDDIDVTGGDPPLGGCGWESIPAWQEPQAMRAVVAKIERLALTTTRKARTTAIGSGNLRSINAGPWGESYFGPEEAAKAHLLDLDLPTHEALWALATECARRYWLMMWGEVKPAPAAAVQAFNYRARDRY